MIPPMIISAAKNISDGHHLLSEWSHGKQSPNERLLCPFEDYKGLLTQRSLKVRRNKGLKSGRAAG
jgi:hypothetical protein